MRKEKIIKMLFSILTPIILGTIVGIIFKDYNSYLDTLNRTIVVPPILFPIVWSILYLLIGVWYYNYEKTATTKNKILYYILLFVNLLFTPVLFYLEKIVLATIIVIILLVGNITLLYDSMKKGKFSNLLVPYIIWLMFALILMIDLVVNNVL